MLELNDAVLEVVSGGHFTMPKIIITNSNYSSINVGHLFAIDSAVGISVTQSIRT